MRSSKRPTASSPRHPRACPGDQSPHKRCECAPSHGAWGRSIALTPKAVILGLDPRTARGTSRRRSSSEAATSAGGDPRVEPEDDGVGLSSRNFWPLCGRIGANLGCAAVMERHAGPVSRCMGSFDRPVPSSPGSSRGPRLPLVPRSVPETSPGMTGLTAAQARECSVSRCMGLCQRGNPDRHALSRGALNRGCDGFKTAVIPGLVPGTDRRIAERNPDRPYPAPSCFRLKGRKARS